MYFQAKVNYRSFSLHFIFEPTLDSGIDVAPGINVAPGTYVKNVKRSP